MSIYNLPLGINITGSPLVDSPYCQTNDIGYAYPPEPSKYLLTENGEFILTENLEFIETE